MKEGSSGCSLPRYLSAPGVITSPSSPYESADYNCIWIVHSPNSIFLEFNVTFDAFPGIWMDRCHDYSLIFYNGIMNAIYLFFSIGSVEIK